VAEGWNAPLRKMVFESGFHLKRLAKLGAKILLVNGLNVLIDVLE
jgi:hypothetical protein